MPEPSPYPPWRMTPTGDRCLLVEFGNSSAPAVNRLVHAFARCVHRLSIDGIVDVAPAFSSVAIHYRPDRLQAEALRERLASVLAAGTWPTDRPRERRLEIPVCFGGDFGPDLAAVAADCGCTPLEVIERHVASAHRVAMLGFAPGFPYITGLDARLALPRRASPRARVPAGSVAIAGGQTGIYPRETPGGWHLIGRTPLQMFDLARASPCLLEPGDVPRFRAISATEFLAAIEANR